MHARRAKQTMLKVKSILGCAPILLGNRSQRQRSFEHWNICLSLSLCLLTISGAHLIIINLTLALHWFQYVILTAASAMDQLALESQIVKRALYVYNRGLEIISINVPLNQEHCTIMSNWCNLRKLSLHGTTIPIQGETDIYTLAKR